MTALSKRLIRGIGVTALSPLVTSAIQLTSVPLMLQLWGAARYGEWVLLTTIPSYLALCDVGFGDASGSDMTIRVAASDKVGALETFQSSWILLTALSVVAVLFAAVAALLAPWKSWFALTDTSSHEVSIVLVVFAAYTVLTQQYGILESGFRCDGNYIEGTFWGDILRLVETALALTVVFTGGSFAQVALAFLLVRCLGTVGLALVLTRRSPWLSFGRKYARWKTIKGLGRPAASFVVLPLAQLLSLQGSTLIVGLTAGPLAVTVLSTIRTLTRLNFQVVNAVGRTLWPELSVAFGARNIPLARKLHRIACQGSLALSLSSATLLVLAGPTMYRMWLHNRVPFDPACFHILLAVSIVGSLWYTSSIVPMSTNVHHNLVTVYFLLTIFGLGAVWCLTPRFGIVGVSVCSLCIEVSMFWIVLKTALRQVYDTPSAFLKAIATSKLSAQVITRTT